MLERQLLTRGRDLATISTIKLLRAASPGRVVQAC